MQIVYYMEHHILMYYSYGLIGALCFIKCWTNFNENLFMYKLIYIQVNRAYQSSAYVKLRWEILEIN